LTHAAQITKIVSTDGHTEATVLPYDPDSPASTAFNWETRNVLPAISLQSRNETWTSKSDLLASDRNALEFVAEMDDSGAAALRFGDGKYGRRPADKTVFEATYRIGNGAAGNVGAETLAHILTDDDSIVGVRNPLPARGGVEPETIEHVRAAAPFAFLTQERAVTQDDYARVAERRPEVQRAAATFRWTGSWRTVFLTADPVGKESVDSPFKDTLRQFIDTFRMAGYDLEIESAIYVSLEIEMTVCVQHDHFRADVEEALLQIFSNRTLPDGRRGVFHSDNFTFGQPVYLSPLYEAALDVDGVASVDITTFQRQDNPNTEARDTGKLSLGRLQIAQLDNDPNFPEHGVFRLTMVGGK
jgi:predicted phage baseplate assembly protein